MTLLYESRFARLELDPDKKLVRFVRSEVPFDDIDTAIAAFRRLIEASATLTRSDHAVLIDLRRVAGRNDESFENAIAPSRRALFSPFRRRATLVRTMAGKLQLQRLNRTDAMSADVFDDEAAALTYLESSA